MKTILNPIEQKITELVTDGLTNADIAQQLGITRSSVVNHIHRIFDKTGMGTRLELALWFLSKGGK